MGFIDFIGFFSGLGESEADPVLAPKSSTQGLGASELGFRV